MKLVEQKLDRSAIQGIQSLWKIYHDAINELEWKEIEGNRGGSKGIEEEWYNGRKKWEGWERKRTNERKKEKEEERKNKRGRIKRKRPRRRGKKEGRKKREKLKSSKERH